MEQPQIVSDWAAADQTSNHLELALTDRTVKTNGAGEHGEQLIAIRDTFDPDRMLYVTPGQIRALARAVEQRDTPAARILVAAGKH